MVGFNWETKFLKDVAATGYNLLSETLNDLNLVGQGADGEKRMEVGGGQNEYALMGFFGRLNYDYKGKYLVEASGRYDGTSRFKRGQRWGFFPSFSLGWRVSEEAFFDGIRDQFNNLKLRFSYGQLGNQNVGYTTISANLDRGVKTTCSAATSGDHLGPGGFRPLVGAKHPQEPRRGHEFPEQPPGLLRRATRKDMLTAGIAPAGHLRRRLAENEQRADLRTKGYSRSTGATSSSCCAVRSRTA